MSLLIFFNNYFETYTKGNFLLVDNVQILVFKSLNSLYLS